MHLNLALLKDDDDMAIARTIIHEANHKFAHTHGTKYGGKTELYAINKQYKKQIPKDAKECADSYAWAAISLWHTHLLTADIFSNGLGCSPASKLPLSSPLGPDSQPVTMSYGVGVGEAYFFRARRADFGARTGLHA